MLQVSFDRINAQQNCLAYQIFFAQHLFGLLHDFRRDCRRDDYNSIAVREQVNAEIEPLRQKKVIGSSLQAKVILSASPEELAFLQAHAKELPALFIVSEVDLRPGGDGQRTVTIERTSVDNCRAQFTNSLAV